MKKSFLIIPLLIALPIAAQTRAGSFELSPFVGQTMFDKNQNLKDHFGYGGRLAYNFTSRWALEGTVEFVNSNVDDPAITAYRSGQFRAPTDEVKFYNYHLDLLYNFRPDETFNPFITFGTGAAHYSPKISDKDMSTFDVGVGFKWWLADHFAVRFDLRDNLVTEVSPFQKSYQNVNAQLGLVFAFGGKRKAAPVAAYMAPAAPPPEKVVIVVAELPAPVIVEQVQAMPVKPKVVILAFEDVHFDFDKSTLRDDAKLALRHSITLLKMNPDTHIRVAGYTSAAGTEAYNQALSERRANAVRTFLIEEGLVPADHLTIIGYGEDRPAEHESSPKDLYSKAAKANMRVLFEIQVK